MSFKVSRRAKSILASLLITSNFVNSKINAMESKPEPKSGQNKDTCQQQKDKPHWQVRGEQAVKDEENLLFEGDIVGLKDLDNALQNTVNYCQKVYDDAKLENPKLLLRPTKEQRSNLGIGHGKVYYNKLLELSDKKQVMGCQIVSAHLMRQLTSNFFINASLEHDIAIKSEVKNAHTSVLVPCADGQLYVLNVLEDNGEFYSSKVPLLTYADNYMANSKFTKCCPKTTVGLYIRLLLNQIINGYKDAWPEIVKSLTRTVNEIDQKGDWLLQPILFLECDSHEEFSCKPEGYGFLTGDPYVYFCFCLISDDDKTGDYRKYNMNVWNAAKNIGDINDIIYKKEHWENFLKLADAFPQSKILIACPNAFKPKVGDTVTKLAIKGREAIKNLGPNGDGKVFQRVLSLKEFLEIESKYDSELRKLLEAKNYKFS